MTAITVRWSGPSDATSGSTYKIERTTDNVSWTTLAATQAATSPYVAVSNTILSNTSHGAGTVSLTSAASFGTSGYLWLDDALVEWTGKTSNDLTGCVWHSGYGTYAGGTAVYSAHESYADTATITLNAVVYRVTHTDSAGRVSAPTYIWYYAPPVPSSSSHCVVVSNIAADLSVESRVGVAVQAYLAADTEFSEAGGIHLDAAESASSIVTTNDFGLAFHHCWKNSARFSLSGTDAAYEFVLDQGGTAPLIVRVLTVPDLDWVLLSQIAETSLEGSR